ncbi:histidine phosphatase family protein [Massilia sp. Dwa41.01b]|uniref:histidine phosphatase family protein n=1 Tax=unclassified Massilia TaxID=2609279 RepID=UPI001600F5D0|nr:MULTISPECIES: histidine phosphatase family protein [unclassified Massilia]QNA87879.1 histidine phosphatase family protein [Massilia sp. Dwa41.01b]QNA98785.1 histidine phosphatase family protein [Massilia sp. Se16.2.3]
MQDDKTTRILLIRHGETAWNAERRLQGHLDIDLNEEGRRQARALAAALGDEPIDVLVASDLARASQTAKAIGDGRGLPLFIDARLRERCYGGFEGLLYSEIAARFPHAFAAWQGRDVDAVLPPGKNRGESFREFYDRSIGAILGWAADNPGRTLALVAHGGVLECAYRAALGLSLVTPRDFKIHNASINRFLVKDSKLELVNWGEVEHLRDATLDDVG